MKEKTKQLTFFELNGRFYKGVQPYAPEWVTTVIFDGVDLTTRDEHPSIGADVEPRIPVALFDKIRSDVINIVLNRGRVHCFVLDPTEDSEGILFVSYLVKDDEWVREWNFTPHSHLERNEDLYDEALEDEYYDSYEDDDTEEVADG